LDELRHAENEIGERLPGELADLYARMSGATLGGEVILFPLTDAHDAGVIEKTRKKMIGLPAAGLWRFGRKGDTTHLIAVRASSIRDVNRPMLPAWCAERPPDAWLFGTWAEHGDDDELKLYPSLERMMSVILPPPDDDSFGEKTYVRALDAVEQALLSSMQAATASTGKARRERAGRSEKKAGKKAKKNGAARGRTADEKDGAKAERKADRKRAKKEDAKSGKKRAKKEDAKSGKKRAKKEDAKSGKKRAKKDDAKLEKKRAKKDDAKLE